MDPTILVANGAGFVAGCYFTYTYSRFKAIPSTNYMFAIGMNLISISSATLLPKQTALFYLGLIGDLTAIILLSSPLVTMKTVLKEKSSESMPFYTSLAMWLNSCSWAVFGWTIINDPFVYIPNVLGFTAASIQLALIAKYPSKK